tara:strand:+ start:1021 stop:1197 length:177 start_codon:yes stop_codon:yes gene_type:complete
MIVTAMASMPTMTAMHEDMHQRASQQDQPDPVIADMRPVFHEQEVSGHGKKEDAHHTE